MIYVISSLISLPIAFLADKVKQRHVLVSHFLLALSLSIWFVLAAIRYFVGTDYEQYVFLQIPEVLRGKFDRVEILYRIVINLGFNIGEYQGVFILTHLIIMIFIYLALINSSVNYTWSVFVFIYSGFFNISLNIMRQAIAMSIFLYAIKFIRNKEFTKYVIYMLFAVGFHKLAILYIPVYFINRFKIKPVLFFMISIFAFIFNVRIRSLFYILSTKFNFYTSYFGSKYDTQSVQKDFIFFIILLFLINYSMYIFGCSKEKKEIEMSLTSLLLFITMVSPIIPNASRVIYMLFVCQILVVPSFLNGIQDRYLKVILSLILMILFILIFVRLIIIRNMGETLPYMTIFGW